MPFEDLSVGVKHVERLIQMAFDSCVPDCSNGTSYGPKLDERLAARDQGARS
jgi:hypothetical protein